MADTLVERLSEFRGNDLADLCDAAEEWQPEAIWGAPVVVGGLSSGTTYQFSVAAGNPKDGTPTTGERSASAYSGNGSATTDAGNVSPTVTINNPVDLGNVGGPPSYTIDGTASDDVTVSSVRLQIVRGSDYWDDSTQDWTIVPTWVPDTALTNGGGWATWSGAPTW